MLKFNKYYFIFFLVNFCIFNFVVIIFTKLQNLGDVDLYLQKPSSIHWTIVLQSTMLIRLVAGSVNHLLGEYFAHFFFFCLAHSGFTYLLNTAKLSKRYTLLMMCMFCMPSLGIWSSVVGKEAVVIFSSSVIIANLINLYRGHKVLYLLLIPCLYLFLIIKPHIFIIFLFCFVLIFLKNKFRQKIEVVILFLIFTTFLSTIILSQIYHIVDAISLSLPVHFSSDARLTRENIYFVEPGDIFKLRPGAWILSFVGLKISEVQNTVDFIFYLEGRVIATVVVFLAFFRSKYSWLTGRLSLSTFLLATSFLLWIVLTNYPMSILNPGSGMRYRSGMLPVLLIFLACFPMVNSSAPHYSKIKNLRI